MKVKNVHAEKKKIRSVHVHEISKSRSCSGQYHTLFPILRTDEKEFKKYMRMSSNTFDYILSRIKDKLSKSWCNLHKPIYEEEQLVITLRLL